MKGNVCEKRWKKALCGILSAVTLLPAMGVPTLAEGYDK